MMGPPPSTAPAAEVESSTLDGGDGAIARQRSCRVCRRNPCTCRRNPVSDEESDHTTLGEADSNLLQERGLRAPSEVASTRASSARRPSLTEQERFSKLVDAYKDLEQLPLAVVTEPPNTTSLWACWPPGFERAGVWEDTARPLVFQKILEQVEHPDMKSLKSRNDLITWIRTSTGERGDGVQMFEGEDWVAKKDRVADGVIPHRNGLFDVHTGVTTPYFHGDFITNDVVLSSVAPTAEDWEGIRDTEQFAFVQDMFERKFFPEEAMRNEVLWTLSSYIHQDSNSLIRYGLNLFGDGSNGKSRLRAILEIAYGKWIGVLQPHIIQPNVNADPTKAQMWVLLLQGKRVVFASEPDRSKKEEFVVKTSIVKAICGDDPLYGRFQRQNDGFPVTPTYGLCIISNAAVAVDSTLPRDRKVIRSYKMPNTFADVESVARNAEEREKAAAAFAAVTAECPSLDVGELPPPPEVFQMEKVEAELKSDPLYAIAIRRFMADWWLDCQRRIEMKKVIGSSSGGGLIADYLQSSEEDRAAFDWSALTDGYVSSYEEARTFPEPLAIDGDLGSYWRHRPSDDDIRTVKTVFADMFEFTGDQSHRMLRKTIAQRVAEELEIAWDPVRGDLPGRLSTELTAELNNAVAKRQIVELGKPPPGKKRKSPAEFVMIRIREGASLEERRAQAEFEEWESANARSQAAAAAEKRAVEKKEAEKREAEARLLEETKRLYTAKCLSLVGTSFFPDTRQRIWDMPAKRALDEGFRLLQSCKVIQLGEQTTMPLWRFVFLIYAHAGRQTLPFIVNFQYNPIYLDDGTHVKNLETPIQLREFIAKDVATSHRDALCEFFDQRGIVVEDSQIKGVSERMVRMPDGEFARDFSPASPPASGTRSKRRSPHSSYSAFGEEDLEGTRRGAPGCSTDGS